MNRKLSFAAVATVLLVATLTLAACSGAGLPSGEAYLTIQNQNTTGSGYDYTNVYLDNKTSLTNIPAGSITRNPVTIGQHSVTMTFDGHSLTSPTLQVPSGGCTLYGPTTINPTNTGFTSSGC